MAAVWRVSRVRAFSRLFTTTRTPSRSFATSSTIEDDPSKPEPPNGFLFNEKPLRPGEKRQKEEWENVYFYGMLFNFFLFLAVFGLKPDTSISTWARGKALERLAEEEASGTDEE